MLSPFLPTVFSLQHWPWRSKPGHYLHSTRQKMLVLKPQFDSLLQTVKRILKYHWKEKVEFHQDLPQLQNHQQYFQNSLLQIARTSNESDQVLNGLFSLKYHTNHCQSHSECLGLRDYPRQDVNVFHCLYLDSFLSKAFQIFTKQLLARKRLLLKGF